MVASSAFGVLLSGGSPIDVDGTLLFQLGVFFFAFFILRSLVFNPVMALFEAREAAVGGAKRDADQMQADAESKRDHFEFELRRVTSESNAERDALRAEAQTLAREQTEKARAEGAKTLADAKTRLDADADKIRSEAQTSIPGLAREIASKLLDRSVN